MTSRKSILLAEDDANDVLLVRSAFEAVGLENALVVVRNGQEAIDYLSGTGAYGGRKKYPVPTLLLLDLNMPGVDGFEVLAWRNTQKRLRDLPIIVLSSSNFQSDVHRAMDLGAAGYRVKPGDFHYLREVARQIRDQWFAQDDMVVANRKPMERVSYYARTTEKGLSSFCRR